MKYCWKRPSSYLLLFVHNLNMPLALIDWNSFQSCLSFIHSKCKRSSLRSQCWMRLFLRFSNTVRLLHYLSFKSFSRTTTKNEEEPRKLVFHLQAFSENQISIGKTTYILFSGFINSCNQINQVINNAYSFFCLNQLSSTQAKNAASL